MLCLLFPLVHPGCCLGSSEIVLPLPHLTRPVSFPSSANAMSNGLPQNGSPVWYLLGVAGPPTWRSFLVVNAWESAVSARESSGQGRSGGRRLGVGGAVAEGVVVDEGTMAGMGPGEVMARLFVLYGGRAEAGTETVDCDF